MKHTLHKSIYSTMILFWGYLSALGYTAVCKSNPMNQQRVCQLEVKNILPTDKKKSVFAAKKNPLSANDGFRDLIILLDDGAETPYSMGFAMTFTLISALSNAEYPILVGSSLWSNFAQRKQEFEQLAKYPGSIYRSIYDHFIMVNKRVNHWLTIFSKKGLSEERCKQLASEKINQEFCSTSAVEKVEREGKLPNPSDVEGSIPFLLCYLTPFDQRAWKIYEVSPDLYLFVPVSYLKRHAVPTNQRKAVGSSTTTAERTLGLKIDHLKPIRNPFDRAQLRYQKRPENEFISKLSNIFVSGQQNHAWNFYLVGHGLNSEATTWGKSVIANLSLDEFRKMLLFLETKEKTNMFVYTSCFAGGQHLKKVYQSNGKTDRFSYPIVVTCLTDIVANANPVFVNLVSLGGIVTEKDMFKSITTGKWELKLTCEKSDWKLFFAGLNRNLRFGPDDSEALFNTIQAISSNVVNNVPWIRLPKNDHFRLLACPSDCTKINAELVNKQKAIGGYIELNKNIQNIFLMTPNIAVPVILSSQYSHSRFISLIPGNATHLFVNCISNMGLTNFISKFYGLAWICFDKTFIVKEMKCANDLSAEHKKHLGVTTDNIVTLKDVVIYHKAKDFDMEVLFKTHTNDKVYSAKICFDIGGPMLQNLHHFSAMSAKDYKIYVDSLEKKAVGTSEHAGSKLNCEQNLLDGDVIGITA